MSDHIKSQISRHEESFPTALGRLLRAQTKDRRLELDERLEFLAREPYGLAERLEALRRAVLEIAPPSDRRLEFCIWVEDRLELQRSLDQEARRAVRRKAQEEYRSLRRRQRDEVDALVLPRTDPDGKASDTDWAVFFRSRDGLRARHKQERRSLADRQRQALRALGPRPAATPASGELRVRKRGGKFRVQMGSQVIARDLTRDEASLFMQGARELGEGGVIR